jgi:hypothetical protein
MIFLTVTNINEKVGVSYLRYLWVFTAILVKTFIRAQNRLGMRGEMKLVLTLGNSDSSRQTILGFSAVKHPETALVFNHSGVKYSSRSEFF